MKLLLDTHAFMWFVEGSTQLHTHARKLIEEESNTRLLSVGSLWEMCIKSSLGKLDVRGSFEDLVVAQVEANDIGLLAIQPDHLDILRTLPFHHRDPFDRLLIAQSIAEGAVLVSRDSIFARYPTTCVWSG